MNVFWRCCCWCKIKRGRLVLPPLMWLVLDNHHNLRDFSLFFLLVTTVGQLSALFSCGWVCLGLILLEWLIFVLLWRCRSILSWVSHLQALVSSDSKVWRLVYTNRGTLFVAHLLSETKWDPIAITSGLMSLVWNFDCSFSFLDLTFSGCRWFFLFWWQALTLFEGVFLLLLFDYFVDDFWACFISHWLLDYGLVAHLDLCGRLEDLLCDVVVLSKTCKVFFELKIALKQTFVLSLLC